MELVATTRILHRSSISSFRLARQLRELDRQGYIPSVREDDG